MHSRSNAVVILPTHFQTWLNARAQIAVGYSIEKTWIEHTNSEDYVRILIARSIQDYYTDNPSSRVIALWIPSLSNLEIDNLFASDSKPNQRIWIAEEINSMIEQAEEFGIQILRDRYLNISIIEDLCTRDFDKYYNSGDFLYQKDSLSAKL